MDLVGGGHHHYPGGSAAGSLRSPPAITTEQAIAAALPRFPEAQTGEDDFRISYGGGDTLYDAYNPAVAYNATDNEYLVVWESDDIRDEEYEIYGQRINAAGVEIGVNDFRISSMGPDLASSVSLPAGVTFVSAGGLDWTCAEFAGVVNCDISALDASASAVLTLQVIAPPVAGPFSVLLTIGSSNQDMNLSNNTTTITTHAGEPPAAPGLLLFLPLTIRH